MVLVAESTTNTLVEALV